VGPRDQVERTIRRHAMLAGGETVLVAVSGGADSVALLHFLVELAAIRRPTPTSSGHSELASVFPLTS
jgi:3'-phosphoadenosine 5'-phosphosulfate sulfotransferase (PAPS reductase)/FAD synthetase